MNIMNQVPEYRGRDDAPAEIRPAWERLDRLAALDRGSARADLERLVFERSAPELGGRARVVARLSFVRWRVFRIAAALAVTGLGVYGAFLLGGRPAPAPPGAPVAPVATNQGTAVDPVIAEPTPVTPAPSVALRLQLDAELESWTAELSPAESGVASLTSRLGEIESSMTSSGAGAWTGGTADPWDALEPSDKEPSR